MRRSTPMLHGNLSEVSIAELIKYARQEKKPLQLQLQHDGQEASLYFINGQIVRASMGSVRGKSVIDAVLGWQDGRFRMNPGAEPPQQPVVPQPVADGILQPNYYRAAPLPDLATAVPPPILATATDSLNLALKKVLVKLDSELPGFLAAAVVDMDGLSVAQHIRAQKTNIDKLSAQMALFIKLVETSVGKLEAGVIEDNLLVTEDAYLLFWFIKGQPYFLGIGAVRQATLLGHLRLIGRLYVERIAAILSQTIKGARMDDRAGETSAASPLGTGP